MHQEINKSKKMPGKNISDRLNMYLLANLFQYINGIEERKNMVEFHLGPLQLGSNQDSNRAGLLPRLSAKNILLWHCFAAREGWHCISHNVMAKVSSLLECDYGSY